MPYEVDIKEDPRLEELADWIDVYNIARCLLEAIHEEYGEHITVDYAKQVWLRCCDSLWDWISEALRYAPDPVDED